MEAGWSVCRTRPMYGLGWSVCSTRPAARVFGSHPCAHDACAGVGVGVGVGLQAQLGTLAKEPRLV